MTPGYVLNWTLAGVTTDRSFSAVRAPNRTGTMGSSSPWHCKMARSLALPLAACGPDGAEGKASVRHGPRAARRPKGQEGTRGDTHLGEGPMQRQPAAQCHDASQGVGTGKGRVEGQGPALEEGENDRS